MSNSESLPQRWRAAVADARTALSDLEDAAGEFFSAVSELHDVRSQYCEWLFDYNSAEELQDSPIGEHLEAITELDLEAGIFHTAVIAATEIIDRADEAELPLT